MVGNKDLEKQEGCGVVVHERLTEPSVTKEWLLPKENIFSNIPAFLGPNGRNFATIFHNLNFAEMNPFRQHGSNLQYFYS